MYEFWYDHVKSKYDEKAKFLLYGYKQFHYIYKKMIFVKTVHKMLRQDLITEIMNLIDHYLKEKKVVGLMKDELRGKIIK